MDWNIRKHDRVKADELARATGLRPLTAAILISRGVDTLIKVRHFLNPDLCHLNDPFTLADLGVAVDRISHAIKTSEKILIWGDYDVDGTTGTVLLRKAIRLLGAETEFYIPNRFTEGYGLNIPALDAAKKRGCKVIITVDSGTRNHEAADWASENGIDLIITDHHEPDAQKGHPGAFAFINPKRGDCHYPDKNLAGVGVAYKLADALLRRNIRIRESRTLLQIAAIGTVADVMDLSGENRAIVALGISDLRNSENIGLRALMETAGCSADMTSAHIAYRIGPRINAAGRMDAAGTVVKLFEAEDYPTARNLAETLDSLNRQRQAVQQEITDSALREAVDSSNRHFVVVSGEAWHRGVLGLAASRIAERLYRPAIALAVENGKASGSGRSIAGFDLLGALDSCADILVQYGGHRAAAGMTIESENIREFRNRLNNYTQGILGDDQVQRVIEIDALVSPETLTIDLVREIELLEPFGHGNPRPMFATRGLYLRQDPFVMKEKHLKLHLSDDKGRRFEAIWWNGVEKSQGQTLTSGLGIKIAYTAEIDSWQGNTRLQLVITDLKSDN